MIQSVIEWTNNTVDEKFLLGMIIIAVVVVVALSPLLLWTAATKTYRQWACIDEILKEKRGFGREEKRIKSEQNTCQIHLSKMTRK